MAELTRYARERFADRRITLLVFLLLTLTLVASPTTEPVAIAGRLAVVALLVLAFRLVDDLADRAHDARHQPERVLVQSRQPDRFRLAAVGLLALSAFTVLGVAGADALALMAATTAGLALVYAALPRRPLRQALVLLKYPAITVIAAPTGLVAPNRLALVMLTAFAVVAAHDALAPKEGTTR